MHLITMAHMGEAQGVIELFKLKRITPKLFEGELLSCLITGEGPFEAATSTAHELGRKTYESVINLGIAGTFSEEHTIGEIFPIRSLYLVIENRPQFKSFKSFEEGLDCLTSFERLLQVDKTTPLSGIAHLVDRESWGVAMAAKNAGVKFSSYKLVSDIAGTMGACEMVREKAEQWAQKMALHLQSLLLKVAPSEDILQLPGFHLTFSTRQQFEQMLKRIGLRDDLSESEVMRSLPLERLREDISLPKERARKLLDYMEARLDPMKNKLQDALEAFKLPFEKEGITLQHDTSWESPEIKVSFNIASDDALKNKIQSLEKLSLDPFEKIRHGIFHVE